MMRSKSSEKVFDQVAGNSVAALRERKSWSREQLSRKLRTSSTVIYNYETARSRVPLPSFLSIAAICGVDFSGMIGRYCLAINIPKSADASKLVRIFRQRLRLTQGQLASELGYASSSMIHHFEKGIRDPSVVDLFRLMVLAGDDLRGLVLECTSNQDIAKLLPAGQKVQNANWHEYWGLPFVPAMRQIMRTDVYDALKSYEPGFFASTLGITRGDERQGLEILARCGVIHWGLEKPTVNSQMKIVIPKDIEPATLNRFKEYWWRFVQRHYAEGRGKGILSVDLIPMSEEIFNSVVEDIRALQEKIHNLPLDHKDGFAFFGWGAGYQGL